MRVIQPKIRWDAATAPSCATAREWFAQAIRSEPRQACSRSTTSRRAGHEQMTAARSAPSRIRAVLIAAARDVAPFRRVIGQASSEQRSPTRRAARVASKSERSSCAQAHAAGSTPDDAPEHVVAAEHRGRRTRGSASETWPRAARDDLRQHGKFIGEASAMPARGGTGASRSPREALVLGPHRESVRRHRDREAHEDGPLHEHAFGRAMRHRENRVRRSL